MSTRRIGPGYAALSIQSSDASRRKELGMHVLIDEFEVERAARAKWELDAALRAEFDGDLESWIAYEKARATGLVTERKSGAVVDG